MSKNIHSGYFRYQGDSTLENMPSKGPELHIIRIDDPLAVGNCLVDASIQLWRSGSSTGCRKKSWTLERRGATTLRKARLERNKLRMATLC